MGSMLITIFQAAPIGSMDPSWVDELMSVTSTASDLRAPALHAPPGETRPQNGGKSCGSRQRDATGGALNEDRGGKWTWSIFDWKMMLFQLYVSLQEGDQQSSAITSSLNFFQKIPEKPGNRCCLPSPSKPSPPSAPTRSRGKVPRRPAGTRSSPRRTAPTWLVAPLMMVILFPNCG